MNASAVCSGVAFPIDRAAQPDPGGIVAQQIDVHAPAIQKAREIVGLSRGIIHPVKQAILDGYGPPGRGLMGGGGFQDVPDEEPPSHGQQLGPGLIVGRVERNRQVHVEPGGRERANSRHDPHRGNCDLTPAQGAQFVPGHAIDRGEHVVQVEHRLAHAHENDRLQTAAGSQSLAPERKELAHDFTGAEVAFKSRLGRRAEIAAHRAADLRGNAARRAVGAVVRHQHRLHGAPIGEPEQQLARSIRGHPPRGR